MAPKQTKFVSRTPYAPKNHENRSISVKINQIDSFFFFTNSRVFLIPTEILKRKLIISNCVLTREDNPWRVVFQLRLGRNETPCAAQMSLSTTTINLIYIKFLRVRKIFTFDASILNYRNIVMKQHLYESKTTTNK